MTALVNGLGAFMPARNLGLMSLRIELGRDEGDVMMARKTPNEFSGYADLGMI